MRPSAVLGRTITDVPVEIAGRAGADLGVLELVETRDRRAAVDEAVRDTIDHLVGLGRFEDVRVERRTSTGAWSCAGV